jgi:hypothetical protein
MKMTMLYTRFLKTALLCGLGLSGPASYAAPHKVIDMRVATDSDGIKREISFCARPSPDSKVPGHAFVAFSTVSANGRNYYTVGHTTNASPSDAILTYFGYITSVPGYLSEEKYTAAKENCLVVQVNKNQYETALAAANPILSALFPSLGSGTYVSYSLGNNDCVGFMIPVAKSLGAPLIVPARGTTELPLAYLRRMIDANN